MKKALMGMTALTLLFTAVLAPVSADARHYRDRQSFNERFCGFLERSEVRKWKRFDEDKQWRVNQVQRRIDWQDRRNCQPDDTIVGQLAERSQFTTLAAALERADLLTTLDSAGDYSVFAPTDEAFGELLEALDVTAEELLTRTDLGTILLYHVLGAAVDSATAVSLDGQTAETLAMLDINIELRNGHLFINDSKVVVTDIQATNGVIHVIDTVLVP